MINFQQILESRYPKFTSKHRRTARVIAKFLGLLFYEKRFQQFEEDFPHLEGFDFVEGTLRYFDFHIRLRESERARIPSTGRVVIAANHPIGSLDGLALLHLIRQVRPDVKVIANELLLAVEALRPVLLPVDNMGGKTARQNLKNLRAHLEGDGAILIFPAGEVSRFGPSGVKDGTWQSGFVKIARATKAPILPVFVKGRNSIFFYSLSFLAKPLSTVWLIREMFKQNHNTLDARVGRAVPYEVYSATRFSAKKLASMFRKHVYRLGRNGRPLFRSVETVAPPESKTLVKQELELSDLLGETGDHKKIYLVQMSEAPCVMREIGRLRELTFRLVGEGSGMPRDIDRFDRYYKQLVLWDESDREIVGAYRIGDAAQIIAERGLQGLYTQSLFEFSEQTQQFLQQGLELGRSWIQPRYQTRHSLDYLWYGIGAYVKRHPHVLYLFGPASISRFYGNHAIAQMAHFYSCHYNQLEVGVRPRNPFVIKPEVQQQIAGEFGGIDLEQDGKALKENLAEIGMPIPTLFKHYAQATEPSGVVFTAFNVDPEFGDCVDAFVLADLNKLKAKKRQRYLGTEPRECDQD